MYSYSESIKNKVSRIAFGSCFNYRFLSKGRLDIFDILSETKLDYFIWTGDAVYFDKSNFKDKYTNENIHSQIAIQGFNYTKYSHSYKKLRESTNIIGIWDDHDYGINDGDGSFIYKDLLKKAFLDFLDENENSERRFENRSIYTSYKLYDNKVNIILLDVRYHKSHVSSIRKVYNNFKFYFDYNTFYDYQMIDEQQWEFLEKELSDESSLFKIIITGTQFLPFNRGMSEAWFPNERKRLFDLIIKHNTSGVIFISGDIHEAQVLRTSCMEEYIGYNLYEFTSSGLTHAFRLPFATLFVDNILLHDYYHSKSVAERNFGLMEFSFDNENKENSSIIITINKYNNETIHKVILSYKDLIFKKGNSTKCYFENVQYRSIFDLIYHSFLLMIEIFIHTLLFYRYFLFENVILIVIYIIEIYFVEDK